MKKLSQEETLEILNSRVRKNPKTTLILEAVKGIEVNESLCVERTEWTRRTPFGAFIQQSFRKDRSDKKFSVYQIIDGTGWIVLRTK